MRRHFTFIVRIVLDDDEPRAIRGQVHEPASLDAWNRSFTSDTEFWSALSERLARQPPTPPDGPKD